jgi:hypothetical protein
MLTKSGLTAGAAALMLGAAIFATSAPAQARVGYHGFSTGRIGIIDFDRDGYRRFGYRQWHRYTWFRHFHHRRWFPRYGFQYGLYQG